ncbi:MAG: glycosyltransferase family 4 protein [Planctomycetes bacterium]|nr:glycosyltransferase family 4 protein [Planctomycetota bacterium]
MRRLIHLLGGLEIGGKERVAIELARWGRSRGLDHRLLVFDRAFRGSQHDLDPEGVPVDFVPRRSGFDWSFVRSLSRYILERGIDLIHAHNDSAVVYAAAASRRLGRARPRIVATFHTRPSHATRMARFLCRLSARRADAVTAVSPDLARYYVATRWLDRAEVVWNGVDIERFQPRDAARAGPADTSVVIGNLGRYHAVKRQEDLISAAASLSRAGVEFRCVLAGPGLDRAGLVQRAERVPSLRIEGPPSDVPAFYRSLDVFVICSVEEAAPLTLLEAMASGCCIVATDAGSIGRMIGAGTKEPAGLLVPAADPRALAAAIRRVVEDRTLREELGRRARIRAAQRFSRAIEWARYERLYEGRTSPAEDRLESFQSRP